MYTNLMRLIMIVLSISLSIYSFSIRNLTFCLLLILSTLLLISGYFRYGAIFPALRRIRLNDIDGARKYLSTIPVPTAMVRFAKAYYYLGMGIVKSDENDLDHAMEYLLKAIDLGIRTKHDAALANVKLAEVYLKKGDKSNASVYIEKAENTYHKGSLNVYINELKAQLNETIRF